MEALGVFTHPIADFEEIPDFLFKICEAAEKSEFVLDKALVFRGVARERERRPPSAQREP
jgi:hypothetical protein